MDISYSDFEKVDIRVGKILEVSDFLEARKPAYKLKIDLGPQIGVKNSSAQITQNYSSQELVGSLVLCVVNFAPKQIGPYISEVLTLGVNDSQDNVVLVRPDKDSPLGSKMY
ncbi:MAG: tRNA-binding protein [Candidatus Levybacteria bacterium]|nr:tRNA-binding protein [Candidatus Levybacteria bacterium]